MKILIQTGDKFKCKRNVEMKDDFDTLIGETAYIKGKIYTSDKDECITDEQGNKNHIWDEFNETAKFFNFIS